MAAFYFAESRAHLRYIAKQEVWLERENVRSASLLDRLVVRHGFTPLTETSVKRDTAPIQSMDLQDPFAAAETKWEQEDHTRFQQFVDSDEETEIIQAARERAQ